MLQPNIEMDIFGIITIYLTHYTVSKSSLLGAIIFIVRKVN